MVRRVFGQASPCWRVEADMDVIRVLIVDDHALFRDGVNAILKVAADVEAVGEAANGREALQKAEALMPDVVLMDIQMPDMTGLEATKRILRNFPEIGIIMITMLEDDDSLFAAMRAGARDYLLKGADKAEMLSRIRAVAKGEAFFWPSYRQPAGRILSPGQLDL